MIYDVLTHTPLWVFALFAYLVWQGCQSLRTRTVPVWRVLIVPLVFFIWGVARIVTGHASTRSLLWAWAATALLFGSLAFARGPRAMTIDRSNGHVTRTGSVVPLIRNVSIFLLQYGVAVSAAMKLDDDIVIAMIGRLISSASAGYFAGWAAAFLYRYWRAGRANGPDARTR